ncbi:ribonucleoprotein, putative [Perkinsus marinus ATCC 50983]|uniref:Ribonucleoprotein, putative n=1 Tax=Perkinsus marinus (strain ATCC 50983 / TXsc) TaxID=423536 RepID=C5LQY8_PERM5|nr:ribonucleoprotein, putative [Perkinsus marinus ATCC 50983]EER00873.1 ribonucleoprotein, putative [Perkinsus marinus ATCC 50983]|eukprot:XP_002768155.1 ribonucleoprotein, putative [Perkinsus marinus ATCC 50983]
MSDSIRIPVRLFVGKLPAAWNEQNIRDLFEAYGEVQEVGLIRPKENGKQQTGCAFVKFGAVHEAATAIKSLNGTYKADDAPGFVQVQFANGEPERLGLPEDTEGYSQKLFVGNVPPSTSDDELKQIFDEYGNVTEAYSLESKRASGNKAAFVRFSKKSDALKAIDALNDKYTFPGEPHPITVKCADTREQRLAHKQEFDSHRFQGGGDRPFRTPDQGGFDRMQQLGSASRDGFQSRSGGYQPPPPPPAVAQPRRAGPWTEYLNHPDGRYYYHNSQTGQTQWEVPFEFQNMGPPPPPPQQQPQSAGFQQTPQGGVNLGPGGGYGQMNMSLSGQQSGRSQQQQHGKNGPPGANVFVYNIPGDWKDGDLAREFSSCGSISTTKKSWHGPVSRQT